jgi:linoleoyl-CoA desaturase
MAGERALFAGGGAFHKELRARSTELLTPSAIRRGRWFVSIKGAVIGVWALASYVGLLLTHTWWIGLPLALSLSFALAGVAFAVGHDANHGSFTGSHRWNRVLGYSFDLIGASSYLWRTKHNTAHHSFTNVVGADDDIDQMPFARLAPDQPLKRHHRFQHIYLWPLYGLFTVRKHLGAEIAMATRGNVGGITRQPAPAGMDLFWFVAGKVGFWCWAVVIPLFFHSWWVIALVFLLSSWVLGFVLATVFQLAHCVDEADFTTVEALREGEKVGWAEHQVETTVDFAPGNKLLAWYLGGLNFQIEHHLFPKVCHVHYPRLARMVRETCAEHGVRHTTQPTLRKALAAHGRWLRMMGTPTP